MNWKVKRIDKGWLARRPECPPKDHFCWRAVFAFSLLPGCKVFDTWTEACTHAIRARQMEEALNYM